MFMLIKQGTEQVLLKELEIADSIWKRFCGLMLRKKISIDKGLLLRPTNSVHTFFMKFPIDVIFIDKNHRVLEVTANMKPNRISKIVLKSAYVIESNADTLSRRLKVGDRVKLLHKTKQEGGD